MFDYFDGNYAWNLAVVTLVEDVGTISEPAEAFRAVRAISGAPVDVANPAWFEAMSSLGDKLERMAAVDTAAKHPMAAARKHHRAAMYFLRAERMISHHDERRLATYRRAIANFRMARELGEEGVEFIDIPYQGGFMPALFVPAVNGEVAPIIIHIQGFDSVKETQWPVLQEYRRRGLSVLIVDQPGAGGALRLYGLTAVVETETYVSAIIDYVQSRPDMRHDQIGLTGISMGGFFAPRAAAFEPRVKALAAWGAFYSAATLAGNRGDTDGVANPSIPNPGEHAQWSWGLETPGALYHELAKLTLEGILDKIECPFLIIHGENDRQVPLQQAIDTYENAASSSKTLKVFSIQEGGSEHCQIDNRAYAADYLADWFADTFRESLDRVSDLE